MDTIATTMESCNSSSPPNEKDAVATEPKNIRAPCPVIHKHPRITAAVVTVLLVVAVILGVTLSRENQSSSPGSKAGSASSALEPSAPSLKTTAPSMDFLTPSPSPSRNFFRTSTPTWRRFPSSTAPSPSPSLPIRITYRPGNLSSTLENQLYLSQGLSSKIIANTGQPVFYPITGQQSEVFCHSKLDFGATYDDPRSWNQGGWIYVSNSEDVPGGVGAFTFDIDGNVVDYRMVLTGTSKNCGGGKTPWNAWISCEERSGGRCHQVDPTGQREAQVITMGGETGGGLFESFAYWIGNESAPQFFITEDAVNGTVRRFIPDDPDWSDPWSILLGQGTTLHLVVDPSARTFLWTSDVDEARVNAQENYPGSEGIDQFRDQLFIISKRRKMMLVLNLNDGTYTEQSTEIGNFDGEPDQITRMKSANADDILFFAEDNDLRCGIFAFDSTGMYQVLNTPERDDDSTSGIAFSPDGNHMYVAIYNAGILYDITRDDGQSFESEPPDIIYE